MEVINTGVASSVGGAGVREQEVGGVIDSWQGVVLSWVHSGRDELEGASWELRLDRACDAEV